MWTSVGKWLMKAALWCSQHPEVLQIAEQAVASAKSKER